MKTLEEFKINLESKIAGLSAAVDAGVLVIPKEHWFAAAQILKQDFDYLSSVTGVDYTDRLEAVYHLYSMEKGEGPIVIKVRTDRAEGKIPSVTPIWRSAEYQEREAYDLFGIHFEGHPDLRRILMWDEFKHHPMRKDYQAK